MPDSGRHSPKGLTQTGKVLKPELSALKTGKPVQTGIMSSTILGGSAAGDDAYTTAIMAMGREKAIEFIQTKLTDRRVVFTLDKI